MANNELKRLIPEKSWDAYVDDHNDLDEVLCALIVEPEAAIDAASELWTDLPHRMRDFREQGELLNQGPMAMDRLLEVLAAWIRTTSSKEWMQQIASYNQLLGIWCASYVLWKKTEEIKPGNVRLAKSAAKSFAESVEDCVTKGIDTDAMKDAYYYTLIMGKARNRAVDYSLWVRDEPLPPLATTWPGNSRYFDSALSTLSLGTQRDNKAALELASAVDAVRWMVAARQINDLGVDAFPSASAEELRYQEFARLQAPKLQQLAAEACLRFPH